MTILSTAELYAIFLSCDWWIELSRRKRALVGHCERCPAKDKLQSHHRIYRENWFDTVLSDLEVLCRDCHEEHHGIAPDWTKPVPDSIIPESAFNKPFVPVPEPQRMPRKQPVYWEPALKPKKLSKMQRKMAKYKGRPRHGRGKRWAQRGNSSN